MAYVSSREAITIQLFAIARHELTAQALNISTLNSKKVFFSELVISDFIAGLSPQNFSPFCFNTFSCQIPFPNMGTYRLSITTILTGIFPFNCIISIVVHFKPNVDANATSMNMIAFEGSTYLIR